MKTKRIEAGSYEVTTDVGEFRVWQEPLPPRRWFLNEREGDRKWSDALATSGHETRGLALKWLMEYIEGLPLTCRECLQEFDRDEMTDGVCDECGKEECPECDGTGMNPDCDDMDDSDCDYCGGDGVV